MTGFKALLVLIAAVLLAYTAVVASHHGLNLLPVFFGDMATLSWPGQFNLDFMFMLTLSALWVSWRHGFSGAGIALGLGALFLGSLFLGVYLFVECGRAGNDPRRLLLGSRA